MKRSVRWYAVVGMVLSGCAGPPPAEWVLDVSEAHAVLNHDYVPPDARCAEFGLRANPAYTANFEAEELGLANVEPKVVVDSLGQAYVVDFRANTVWKIDQDGSVLGPLAPRGQGPGELLSPVNLVETGEEIIVFDASQLRISRYALSGEYLGSVRNDAAGAQGPAYAIADNAVALVTALPHSTWPRAPYPVTVTTISPRSSESQTVSWQLPRYPGFRLVVNSSIGEYRTGLPLEAPDPRFAAHRGHLYAAAGHVYQVFALDGQIVSWALRVPWPIKMPTEAQVADAAALLADPYQIENRLTQFPAIREIMVHEDGHLFVIPWSPPQVLGGHRGPSTAAPSADIGYPVDVYGRDGELIGNASIPVPYWGAMHQGKIYRLERNADREYLLARYDLIWPTGTPDCPWTTN